MPASQFPTVPTPPRLAKIVPSNGRVYFDCNVTPVVKQYLPWLGWTVPGSPEPDSNGNYAFVAMHDHEKYSRDAGLTPTLVLYNQTIGQATMWSTNGVPDVLPFVTNRYQYNQNNGNTGADYMQAGNQGAQDAQEAKLHESLNALCKLTHDDVTPSNPYVTYYGGVTTDQYMPIIIDIESSFTFNGNGLGLSSYLSPSDWLAKAIRWREMLQTIRNAIGYTRQLFVYGHRDIAVVKWLYGHDPAVKDTQTYADLIEQESACVNLMSGWCSANGYMSDVELRNPNFWFQNIMLNDREIDEYYPQWRQNKMMLINPYYQPSSAGSPYYQQLLPYRMWQTHIEFLAERGWSMFLWLGDAPLVAGYNLITVKPYIDFLARYNK